MAAFSSINEAVISDGQSRASFDFRRKDDYFDALEDHVNTMIKIVPLIGKKRGTLTGRRSLTSVSDTFPASMGQSLFEDSDMPEPTVGSGFNPVVFTRYQFGRLRWSWAVEMMARAGQKGVWKAPRAEDMRQGRIAWEINTARKHYLGPADILGTVSAAADSHTLTLVGRNARTEAANFQWAFGKHYFRKQMPVVNIAASGGNVDPYGPIDGGSVTQRRVSSFDISDPDNPVLTLSGNLDVAPDANTILIPWASRRNANNTDAAAFDTDLAGINGLFNTIVNAAYKEFYLQIDRSSYPTMEGWVFHGDNAGEARPFSEAFIEIADDTITEEGTGDDADVFLCHSSMRREYLKEVKGLRMFAEVLGKRGYGANLVFQAGDTPLQIMTDRDAPPGVIELLDTKSHGQFVEAEVQQIDEGERFVDDKAAHEIVIGRSYNNACKKPHNNALIGDFIYSVSKLTPA